MKRKRDLNIFISLVQQLEEILNKAKANDLCHLIGPIEETILKVKELNRTTKVECEHKGECNSTGDLQMDCSCNDFGPDILGPNGKWICNPCGENCSCSETWDSSINIPDAKKKDSKEERLEKKDQNLCQTGEENFIEDTSACSKKTDFKPTKKKIQEINTSSTVFKCKRSCPVSILYERRPSGRKDSVESDEETLSKQNKIPNFDKSQRQDKLTTCKIQNENLQSKDSDNLSKCKNCKCTIDENKKTIKTEECKAFERRKKLKVEASRLKNNSNFDKKEAPQGFLFNKEEKSCKSGREVLRTSPDLKDESCWKRMKDERKKEQKDRQISKCLPKSFEQCSKKSEVVKEQVICEKPEKALKCSEIAKPEVFQNKKDENCQIKAPPCRKCSPVKKIVSDENKCKSVMKALKSLDVNGKGNEENEICQKRLNSSQRMKLISAEKKYFPSKVPSVDIKDKIIEENMRKVQGRKTACYKCSSSVNNTISQEIGCQCSPAWTEKLRSDFKTLRENTNPPKSEEPETCDEFQKIDQEKCSKSKMQVEKSSVSCNPLTSTEKLCPCGCGYFTEGVPETRPVSCNRSPKNLRQEISKIKDTTSRSEYCDCEGNCDWCYSV